MSMDACCWITTYPARSRQSSSSTVAGEGLPIATSLGLAYMLLLGKLMAIEEVMSDVNSLYWAQKYYFPLLV